MRFCESCGKPTRSKEHYCLRCLEAFPGITGLEILGQRNYYVEKTWTEEIRVGQQTQDIDIVRQFLESLPSGYLTIAELYFYDNHNNIEIANELNMHRNTVGRKLDLILSSGREYFMHFQYSG